MKVKFIRRLLENYCFVLLTNRVPPQISDDKPDMRQRALFVTSGTAWRWNKMLLARENVDSVGGPTGHAEDNPDRNVDLCCFACGKVFSLPLPV